MESRKHENTDGTLDIGDYANSILDSRWKEINSHNKGI